MTATLIQSPDRVILNHISWQTYQSLLKDFEQEPAARLTYDHGTLEIRMPLAPHEGIKHEGIKKLLGRLIEAATEELGLEIRSLGSRTCYRQDLAQGLEPDQCYYIQNEPLVRGVEQIDLGQYPPPDLAIEIDITSSSLNRFKIYAALGVPEVWRYDGSDVCIYHLQQNEYRMQPTSACITVLTTSQINHILAQRLIVSENTLIRDFRQWLRSTH